MIFDEPKNHKNREAKREAIMLRTLAVDGEVVVLSADDGQDDAVMAVGSRGGRHLCDGEATQQQQQQQQQQQKVRDVLAACSTTQSLVSRFPADRMYVSDGRRCYSMDDTLPVHGHFQLCLRTLGGKGGFGSLLRALGNRRSNAETDNIEACRDLSGRRLRHVHDEKAVNEWLAQSEERKEEAARRRRAKLERDIAPPKHTFDRHSLAIELQEQAMSVSAAVGTAITKKTVDEMYPPNVGGSGKKNVATKGDTPHKPAAGNAARRTASARRGVALKDEWDSETTDDAATDDEELAAKRRKHMDAVEARLQKIKAAHAAAATAPSTKKGEDKGTTDAQKEHKKDKEEDDDERKEQGKEEAKQRSNADEEDKEEDDDGESSD